MLVDPTHLGGGEAFAREVTQLVGFVRSCPTKDGVDEIMLPGDPERKNTERMLADGIDFDQGNWDKLLELADQLGVDAPTAS